MSMITNKLKKKSGERKPKPYRKESPITILDTHAEIEMQDGARCLIDLQDVPLVEENTWHNDSLGYVATVIKGRSPLTRLYIHRLIMRPPKGMVVDHKNGDTLDNRRGNLRIATRSDNAINMMSHPLRNIRKRNIKRGWEVRIHKNNKNHHIGTFSTLELAIEARDKAAKEIHGDVRVR